MLAAWKQEPNCIHPRRGRRRAFERVSRAGEGWRGGRNVRPTRNPTRRRGAEPARSLVQRGPRAICSGYFTGRTLGVYQDLRTGALSICRSRFCRSRVSLDPDRRHRKADRLAASGAFWQASQNGAGFHASQPRHNSTRSLGCVDRRCRRTIVAIARDCLKIFPDYDW